MADFDDLLRRLLEQMGSEAFGRVSPQIDSRTLRDALQLIVDVPNAEARLFIPHYWAVYYHDGRGGFGPRGASFLVFFADVRDDPRLPDGQFPVRASELRRLTRQEFFDGLEENARRRKLGLPPFMFVLKSVGPAAAHPFFDNAGGMRGFAEEQSSLESGVAVLFDDFIQQLVDEEINAPRQNESIDIAIRFDL